MKSWLRNVKKHFEFESNPFLEGDLCVFALSFLVGTVGLLSAFLVRLKSSLLLTAIGCGVIGTMLMLPIVLKKDKNAN